MWTNSFLRNNMEKAYNISDLKFEKKWMVLTINDQQIRLRLKDVSEKLSKATDQELNNYKISPSGYGLHWIMIDEDLSINGLLKLAQLKNPNHQLQT